MPNTGRLLPGQVKELEELIKQAKSSNGLLPTGPDPNESNCGYMEMRGVPPLVQDMK